MKEMNIINMNGGELAEWLHDTYERLAKQKNWKTNKLTQVPFNKLPKENQSVMLGLAQCIQVNLAVCDVFNKAKLEEIGK